VAEVVAITGHTRRARLGGTGAGGRRDADPTADGDGAELELIGGAAHRIEADAVGPPAPVVVTGNGAFADHDRVAGAVGDAGQPDGQRTREHRGGEVSLVEDTDLVRRGGKVIDARDADVRGAPPDVWCRAAIEGLRAARIHGTVDERQVNLDGA